MRPLPLLLFVGAWTAAGSPAPQIGPGNVLTYNDYSFNLPPGDLNLDLNVIPPEGTTIGPSNPLTIVFNFSTPETFLLEPDRVHHDTIAYSFQDSAAVSGTFDPADGEFYGGLEIDLDYDGSIVFTPSMGFASETDGPYYFSADSSPDFSQRFTDGGVSTFLVPFDTPTEITFNSAVFVFGESQNVTPAGIGVDVFGYLPDAASTLELLAIGIAAIVALEKIRVGMTKLRIPFELATQRTKSGLSTRGNHSLGKNGIFNLQHSSRIPLIFCATVLAIAVKPVQGQYYTGTSLGFLADDSEIRYSIATGVNDSGVVVGDARAANGSNHAFSYSGGAMTDLGTLQGGGAAGGDFAEANGISDSGVIVGASSPVAGYSPSQAFSYSGGAISGLGTLGGTFSQAFAINSSGLIVGESATSGNLSTHAFSDFGGVMTDLGTLGGADSQAAAVNSSGLIVGTSTTSSGQTDAFSDIGGVMTDLGDFGSARPLEITGVNDSGTIIGTIFNSENFGIGFSEIGGVVTYILAPKGYEFEPTAINDSGTIVGDLYYYGVPPDSSILPEAYIDNGGILTDLNTVTGSAGMDTDLAYATGINNEGQIVGSGFLADGTSFTEAYLLTPTSVAPSQTLADFNAGGILPDDSSSALLLTVGMAGVALAARNWHPRPRARTRMPAEKGSVARGFVGRFARNRRQVLQVGPVLAGKGFFDLRSWTLLIYILFAATLSSVRATPISGANFAEASVTLPSRATVSNSNSMSWTVLPSYIDTEAKVADGSHYYSSAESYSEWFPYGDEGSVDLDYQWQAVYEITAQTTLSWSYTFTADKNENFVMVYNITGIGQVLGLQTISLTGDFDDSSGEKWVIPSSTATNPISSQFGTFVGAVSGGDTYTVSLSGIGSAEDSMFGRVSGYFVWSLNDSTEIPDCSSTFALLGGAIAGVLGVGRPFRFARRWLPNGRAFLEGFAQRN